ncbi:zinc-binding dehydrogenase [Planobispora rosea]|uniref:zinc-binding dehydrogenase n=1 Tax=Planobispora rosea TaxID=35762 RepID=UPI00083A1DB8|nr:zinc-binding dehydrogenase [Planobispora rosea]
MKAVKQYAFGGPHVLVHEDVDEPRPGPWQVRIKVAAAGVSRLDLAVRAGVHPWSPTLPIIPGREVAGVVEALGDGVPSRWLGRRVVTCLGLAGGGYAELAVREVAAVHEIGDEIPDEAAVAAVVTGRTAVGVLDAARVAAGDVVLVLGAAGGVGGMLVQAAANLGATVVGVAGGPARSAAARRHGAAVPVDHHEPGWAGRVTRELAGRPVTTLLDGVGGELGRQAVDLLGYGGRAVVFGWASGTPVEVPARDLYERELTLRGAPGPAPGSGGVRRLEERALAAVRDGVIAPLVRRFPLAEAATAHAELESRRATGKIILVP